MALSRGRAGPGLNSKPWSENVLSPFAETSWRARCWRSDLRFGPPIPKEYTTGRGFRQGARPACANLARVVRILEGKTHKSLSSKGLQSVEGERTGSRANRSESVYNLASPGV